MRSLPVIGKTPVWVFETVIGHTVSPTIVKQSHPQALINASGIPHLAEKFR